MNAIDRKAIAAALKTAEKTAKNAYAAMKRAERARSQADDDMDDDAFDALSAEIVKHREASSAAYAERDRLMAQLARD